MKCTEHMVFPGKFVAKHLPGTQNFADPARKRNTWPRFLGWHGLAWDSYRVLRAGGGLSKGRG